MRIIFTDAAVVANVAAIRFGRAISFGQGTEIVTWKDQ